MPWAASAGLTRARLLSSSPPRSPARAWAESGATLDGCGTERRERGQLLGNRVKGDFERRQALARGRPVGAGEHLADPAPDAACEFIHIWPARWRAWLEVDFAVAGLGEYALRDDGVEMDVEIESTAEPLDDGEGTALAVGDTLLAAAGALEGKHGPQEAAQHLAAKLVVPGQSVAKLVRQCQHPLPYGDGGKYMVGGVSGYLGHASAEAGGAEAAPLAGKGYEVVVLALPALETREACRGMAATDQAAKSTLDKGGQGIACGALGGGEEGLGEIADEVFQQRIGRSRVTWSSRCVSNRSRRVVLVGAPKGRRWFAVE